MSHLEAALNRVAAAKARGEDQVRAWQAIDALEDAIRALAEEVRGEPLHLPEEEE